MKKTIIYTSKTYSPELVTGAYVRCDGHKGNYHFRVYETASGKGGSFEGKPGMGPTLREYDCDGSEFSEEFRNELIKTKSTLKWY